MLDRTTPLSHSTSLFMIHFRFSLTLRVGYVGSGYLNVWITEKWVVTLWSCFLMNVFWWHL